MNLPNFHDGFFDGFYVVGKKVVRLFLRTQDEKRYTLLLEGVEALKITEVQRGNIILDVSIVPTEQLSCSLMEELYLIPPGDGASEKLTQLLDSAKSKGMQCLEVAPSYGAECVALFRTVEVENGHCPPTQIP